MHAISWRPAPDARAAIDGRDDGDASMVVLRTPDECFANLPLWNYEPSYFTSRLYGMEVRALLTRAITRLMCAPVRLSPVGGASAHIGISTPSDGGKSFIAETPSGELARCVLPFSH